VNPPWQAFPDYDLSMHLAVKPHVRSFLADIGADLAALVVVRIGVVAVIPSLLELFIARTGGARNGEDQMSDDLSSIYLIRVPIFTDAAKTFHRGLMDGYC
jgi:hypothetical protein